MDRVGRQSPTVSLILPYHETRGPEAIELYNASDNKALAWQESLTYDIMAANDDGLWIHQKFGYSVPRRNGKSEMALARCIWGLKHQERILYTAHRTSTTHSIWERLSRLCAKVNIEITSSFRAFGKEHLYTADGGVIEFRTRTSTGGLGEGYDLLVVDEAQEYTPEQETALKYVVTDSANPQTIMFGTPPTAISAGTVFPNYRKRVLHSDSYESGWAEWSVPEMSPAEDVDLWYETNPSLGTILKERTIRSEICDDVTDFNIQRLGLWIKYNQRSAISRNEWEALQVDSLPKLTGPMFVGVKFGIDGKNAALAIAIRTYFGQPVTITSGYRTAAYNASPKVGCAKNSQHVKGTDADIKVKNVPSWAVAGFLEANFRSCSIGYYSNWVHVDARGYRALWKDYGSNTKGTFGIEEITKRGEDNSVPASFYLDNPACCGKFGKRKQIFCRISGCREKLLK